MNPAVVAAIIAAAVSLLTLIFSVWAQNKVSADNTRTLEAQREQLQGGFKAQSDQLNSTLEAQGEQFKSRLDHERGRTLNEQFATAAVQLGDDKPPAVRLAGAYAMAGLADDWPENRQTCVDVLCAYLRLPYEPDPGDDAPAEKQLGFRGSREVRHTLIRLITAHLKDDAAVSWQGLNFDFTGAVFDGGDFTGVRFSGGRVTFFGAQFPHGEVSFGGAEFSGGQVYFDGARFSGGQVTFFGAQFSGGQVSFLGAEFSGGEVNFFGAQFSGGHVRFLGAEFSGGQVTFFRAQFSGGQVNFIEAQFTGGQVNFIEAQFSGGQVNFGRALFTGGQVRFLGAEFSGGEVNFTSVGSWSHPPEFDWDGKPPKGVILPPDAGIAP